jgi:hypothetical protein
MRPFQIDESVQEGVENPLKPVFDTPMRTSDLTGGSGGSTALSRE